MIQKAALERPLVDPSVILVGNQRKEEEKFGECFVQILQTMLFSWEMWQHILIWWRFQMKYRKACTDVINESVEG